MTLDACTTGKSRGGRGFRLDSGGRTEREGKPGCLAENRSEANLQRHQLNMCTSSHSSRLKFLVFDSDVQSGPLQPMCRGASGFLTFVIGGGTSTFWLSAIADRTRRPTPASSLPGAQDAEAAMGMSACGLL